MKLIHIGKILVFFFILLHIQVDLRGKSSNHKASETHKEYSINIEQEPMVIVIPSYNNKDWYKKNLESVFSQDYENYRIIYINDASTDDTGQLVQGYIKTCGQEHRTTLIHNPKNRGALANHYTAVHLCEDHEIIINLDGDDFLRHTGVLQKINNIYQNPNIWLTYGQYEEVHYSKKYKQHFTKKGHCKDIPRNIIRLNAYREYDFVASHLRTFYAGVFKQIKLKDFIQNGKFFTAACDMAFMIPMLEMVRGHYKFIDETLYLYNCITLINVFKTRVLEQLKTNYFIRAQDKYQPIDTPFKKHNTNQEVSLIIIAENTPAQIHNLLESIAHYMSGIKNIYVLYQKSHEKKYFDVQKDFPEIILTSTDNLKETLESILDTKRDGYVAFTKDTIIVKDFIDIHTCIKAIEQTKAHGFYLILGKNIKENKYLTRKQYIAPHVEITRYTPQKNSFIFEQNTHDKIYAWQFKDGEYDWRTPNNLLMTIYKASDMQSILENIYYDSCATLEYNFNKQKFDLNNVGLFFETSKIVAI